MVIEKLSCRIRNLKLKVASSVAAFFGGNYARVHVINI